MGIGNLRYYIYEKKRLEKEIDLLNSKIDYGVSSPSFKDKGTKQPSTDSATYFLVMQNIKIRKLLEKRYNKLVKIIAKMYNTINSIKDIELKQIVELRIIQGLTFDEIGEELYLSKTNVYNKYIAFINTKKI